VLPSPEPLAVGDLPLYLTDADPPRARRAPSWGVTGARPRREEPTVASFAPSGRSLPPPERLRDLSPVFSRMIPVDRAALATVLAAWCDRTGAGGELRVQSRLRLGVPDGGRGPGWRLPGRVRRFGGLYWVPVTVEIWPTYGDYVRMTLTPQRRVLASRRYFRLGHQVVDRLLRDLGEIPRQPGSGRP